MKIFAILIALVISIGTAIYAFFKTKKETGTVPSKPSDKEDREVKDALDKIDQKHDEAVKATENHDTSTVAGGTEFLRDYVETRDRAAKSSSGN